MKKTNGAKERKVTVAFAGGGTGGHIYPGLAVADELRNLCAQKNIELNLVWIGCSKGMDRKIVESSAGADSVRSVDMFCGIPSGKLRRYFSLKNCTDIFKIIAGCIASFFILLKIKPAVLFSKGGFVSVPPCFAARLLRIPVCTHECDFTPGLATKINASFAEKILVSYKETEDFIPEKLRKKIVVTGNPVRPVFYEADSSIGKDFAHFDCSKKTKPVLLVMGGSLGAKQINDLTAENIAWLCEHFYVIHQTGNSGVNELDAAPEFLEKNYRPFAFIYEQMPHVMEYADVIISRAGANSIWECTVLKKPMILIPLSGNGTRGDQVDNAEFFEKKGAAIVLKGEYANSNSLKNALTSMLDEKKRKLFSNSCQSLIPKQRSSYLIAELLCSEFIQNIFSERGDAHVSN